MEAEAPVVAPQPARPSWVVIGASVLAVLVVPVLLIWTALSPVPILPYSLLAQEELMEGLVAPPPPPPLPRICTITAKNERQRQRQQERCPAEIVMNSDAEDDAGPASLRPRPDG